MNDAEPKTSPLLAKIGWGFLVAGVVLMIGFIVPQAWLDHQAGLIGLVSIFIGVSLLRKRKDQLSNQ